MIQASPEQPVIERSSLKIGTFIDLATSTKTRADFTVIATCGLDDKANIYILNILRGRREWPDATNTATPVSWPGRSSASKRLWPRPRVSMGF
ncbi:MAG TPA: hypothetical protein PLJ25_03380 [Methanothrix sp.]|nr:hypothetical protein [Methanothrix sp.]